MKKIFAVQTIDRESGEENTVRVEAASADEAREEVLALGEMVGSVKLAEIVKESGGAPLKQSTTEVSKGVERGILKAIWRILFIIVVGIGGLILLDVLLGSIFL